MKDKKYYKKIALKIADIADSKKAENIVIYETGENSSLFYYIIILTTESYPQAESIYEEIEKSLKKNKLYVLHKDGIQSKSWKIMDYGGVIVHIFDPETRNFYGLERLYHKYKIIKFEKDKKTSKKRMKNVNKLYRAKNKKNNLR